MILVSGSKENIFVENQFPIHGENIQLVRNTICQQVIIRVSKHLLFSVFHEINNLLQLFQISIKQIGWGGQEEMFAISFTEVKEEFVSHVITVFNFLPHFLVDFIFDFFVFSRFTIEQLDHAVYVWFQIVYNEVRSSDLTLNQSLAKGFVVVDFVLLVSLC